MRVLVTGHLGYIGTVMVPMLIKAGHEVVGLDSDLYASCTFAAGGEITEVPHIRKDVRDADARDLDGFDAVIHLAALSNDPLGNLKPDITYSINHRASVRLARLAKAAGSSASCSPPRAATTAWPARTWWRKRAPSTRSRPMAPPRSAPSAILPSSPATASAPTYLAPGDRLRPVAAHPLRHRAQ